MCYITNSFYSIHSNIQIVSQKSLFILFLSALSLTEIQAQAVPQTTLVNHFTNSRCGVCAGRNPGFYTNLRQQSNTLHIAFHPSSPYSNCVFSMENPAENDGRTNFYGIYGGTPRLVINGNVIAASQNYALSAMFTPYQGLTSPFALVTTIAPKGADSITATVTITTRAAHNYTTLNLNLDLVQDTVFYAAPNGEQQHYDVFRQSFTGLNAVAFTPSMMMNNTVTIRKTLFKKSAWSALRLYAIANVQTPTKASLQAAASPRFSLTTAVENLAQAQAVKVYPNPAQDALYIDIDKNIQIRKVLVFNNLGQNVNAEWQADGSVNIADLPQGVYFLQAEAQDGSTFIARFLKQN
jgi:Secretion system C-terminal sorting domain